MRLLWDDQAYIDLDEIWNYIAVDNVAAANRVFARLRPGVALLTDHPEFGRKGRVTGTREFIYSDLPYIAVYSMEENETAIVIPRIVHTAQLYPPKAPGA